MATLPLTRFTPEQYLEFDRNSEIRHEYVFGEIVPMTGATLEHALIAQTAGAVLVSRLVGSPCRVFNASLRVAVNPEALYAYPDVTVICGQAQLSDDQKDIVTNPKLIVEVLSPSTRSYDLGDKARMYSTVASLAEMVFIDQKRVWIEHWRRQPKEHWDVETIRDAGATITLESVGCDVMVAEFYTGIEWT